MLCCAAVPKPLRRLVGRAMCQEQREGFRRALGPSQLGVGVAGGAEIAAHACQAISAADPSLVWVSLDCENAFSRVSRQGVLDVIQAEFPHLAAHARLFVARESRFVYVGADGRWAQ